MNDNFSFDGADAADMPLDLSFSSLPLPEGEAAAGFHLPEMTPAQEQAKADSPKLVDEWRQDVQMLDDGGLNGLEERAGLEAGVSLDAEAAEEEGSESFNPQLGDMDSVRRKGSMLMKGVEERKREQARDRQNMVMNLLRAGRNDQEALKRIAERWGEDAVSRLESANEEDRSYMLGMWLEEVLGDGDRDVGFQIYKNTHDLWGKGIVSPEQVWKDFAERGKDIVEREDRQRVERERRISDLNGVVSRYVSGEQDSLSADERMALFHAGVSVASMEKARRGVRLMEAFEQDSRLYHDDIADDLFGIIGNDDDALTMLCNLLRNRSRRTAHDRLGMGGAEKRADEAYQEVMENSNPLVMAVAGQSILNAKMTAGGLMTGKVAGVKTKRSLERALQNMRSHEDARMKAAALQVSVAKARQMGLSDAEAFELAGVQEQERRELQQKRSRIFSALTTALEGGEDDYFSSDEASSLSKVGYHLGSMTGDTAPWFLPYAGPLIGLNTSMQRRREEGYMLGLDVDEIEKRAFWFGAADAAEEMIGFHGLFRATPLYKGVRKLLRTKKGAGVRAQVSGSPAAQYALQGVAGTVEEGILEPTAGYLMRSAINPLLDDERGKQTWDQYASELSQMTSGEQGLALLAFSFGLSGLNYSQLSRAAREFRLSLKNYEALGGTAQGYLEAREEKTAEGFLNKALANLHDSWMEDPQSSMERASAAAGERLSGERIESLRELDAWRAAEDAGMVPRVEPAEQEGMFRVYAPARSTKAKREDSTATTGQQEESNQPSYTLMDGEQMTAYLQAFVSEQMESDILYTQHLLAGDVTVSQALAQGRFDAAEVITRTVTDEQTGAERVVIAPETLGQMKARADMAMAAIRALEAEGVSYEDAAARMDASLSEHLPLGTLVKTWEEAQERIRTEQARTPEFKVPAMDAPFSNAYVTKVRRGDTFRRVLRYARGNATVEDLMEEAMEQAVISWQAEQGLTWGEFGAMLQEAQRAMNDLFPEARGEEMQFIHLDAGKPVTGHDAIEAFSKIGRSRWLADAVNHPSLPSWLRKLLNHLVKFLGAFKARVELGEMVRQAEEQGVFTLPVRQALAVMLDAGNALYRDQQGDLMELSMERARAQAELDAMFGAGVATEARTLEDELAESRKEDEERRKEAEDEARAPENSPEAQEARREREQARVEALGEPDGSGVFNGAFIEVQEGVRLGFIDKNKLTLCPDVPQFKQGADEQTGVVNPIVGAWQRNAAPISVWRREDGSLQVISGRHRFNACTDEDINCTVYDEAAGFDLDWAQTHDVENNIRDGQASLFEIARYVSQKGLTKEEAVERGIFRKGQSRRGVELGMYGCSDLLDALGNELVSPDDAWRVAMAFRNQTEVQRAGLRALMEGKSWQQAFAVMQVAANMDRIRGLAEAAGMTFETDLFGNSHAEEYFARLAQYAAARVSELTREISSISGASRRPETARKYGVDVRDAGALEAVVKDLKAQRARWQNFGLHEDLIKEANDAVMVELGVKTREEVDRENGVLPLEAPEQEAVSADTGMLQLSQDVSRMLDAALARGAAPAEDEAPATNFSLVSIPSGEVITTAAEMRARLKPLQGKVFVNKNTGIQAVIEARVSGKTVGKAQQAQMSVANLKAVGFSAEEARKIHYTAATRIHELFENAEDGRFEEEYKDDPSRAGAYHFFNTVEIEGIGSFDVNVTALALKNEDQKLLYTLELTIENPKGVSVAYPNPDIQGDAYSASGVSTRNLSSYRSFVEKEKASIRKKAVADGTFMKAPNGADTNLTEDQWLSVRTAAFKNWFGDWEHDPQNASKVVDENGEPRVVYHGSHQWFTSFNDGKQRQQSGAPAGTIFANDNREIAVSFADYYGGHADEVILDPNDERHPRYSWGIYREGGIYDLFMNIRNPLVVDFEGRPWLDSSKGGDINALCSKAKESGHDGVIALNIVDAGLNDQENVPASTDYVAFDSVQVKSATQNRGTYDPKNPDITFSVIGPNAATWGKYADKAFAGRDDGKLRAEIDASQASLKAPENFPFLSMFDEWSRGMGYRKNPVWRGLLEDVLNFDELYEAYPSLRKMYVFAYKNKKDSARGYYDSEERSITINLAHIGPIGAQLSTLLHEIQHAIQDIEGFARGSNLEEGRSLDDYMRSAGEIESRNVEKRILWDGERRESKPFNDTLEFPGEAIVSFSIASAQEQGLFHDGHFEAGNAVITKPGVTFSIAALHASPHSFRKFDTAFMGKGEGAQAYGWGLYFATNPKVNRSYLNQFAQDKTTWKFREVETAAIEEMQRALVGSFLPKDALPEAKEDASDIAWSVLGDLVDAAKGSMTVLDIVMELHDEIDTNRKYAETYPQEREKLEQLEGFLLSLLDHLDEIEARPGMPSNYKVELNVEDSELLGWDYVDETVLALLKDSPVEEVRYALEHAERRADYRGENVSGKDVYQELFDAFWDGEDGTKQEAQKAASVSLLSSDIKGIRYADGYTRGKVEEEQTYNYVIFDGNDIKITAFADESTGGAWADYEDPTATFSLSEGFPRRVSRGTQNLEVVHRIAADLRADAATWGRYDGKTDEAAFLVNVGRNVALVKSALMHLPAGYRVAVKPYIDRLQILAELAAKGKIDETRMVNAFARREIKREMAEATREGMEEAEITARVTAAGTAWEKGKKPTQKFAKEVFEDEMEKVRKAWAEKRLHELMAEVMEKAAGKLEALAKDGVSAGMARMLDQVLTIRKKNGKQQKGKVSMEAYAYLTDQVVPLLRMTAMEKEAAMNEAAAELDKLEKENPDQMDGEAVSRMEELREELTRLALYGNLEGMSVDEAQAAAKALEIYINTEKEGWAAVQEAAAERLNAIGRRIVEKFNQTGKKADENTLRAANEKFHGKVSFKNFGDFMENMDQLLTRMGTMPALQEFSADMRSRLTNAFQQMRDARGLRAAAVQDLYEKHLTEKVMKARKVGNMAGWVTWFKTSHDTKVRLNGWITQTARLTLEQAREVREMDARQRKEFIRKRWEEGMEYFSEETLDLLLTRLKEHEDAAVRARAEGRRPVYRKYVTAKASFKGEESSPLVLSRDNALYLVLQSEQEDYREMMKQQGYTPEVISALREYVGEEGMAIGYGLRELLKAQGDKIGRLYEQVTGVPFPRVENYFPARFWALDAMSDADAADMISGVPSTKGGNQGWQRVRTKHHRRLDTSVGALSVFWEATDMTDHWYYTQDITADFRGLLRRREVAESLVANLGKDDFVRLRRWVDLLERAGVVQGQAVGSLDKLLNAVYSGQAKAILAFRFETLMKQGSAVLNAWIGDPGIGFWDYLGTMAKMRNGTAEMGVIKMMKSAEFQARLNDRVDVETLSRLRDDSSYTLAEAALVWGMNGIEYTDVFFNAVGSAALWNIKYQQAVKAGVEEGRAKDEAWQAVRNALHSAQPQTWIDKSFGGLHRGAWGRAIFYMMSENFNKTAAIYGLARAGFAPGVTPKQRWASLSKAGKVWLAYGAFNAIIGAMLDYMKDDEEEWEKRDWQGYLFAALSGPIAGMPLVSEAVEWMFSELLGAKVYTGSAGRALIDFRSGWNAAWKLGEMIQEGGYDAGDYMKQVIRLGRVFGAAGGIASGMTNKAIQTAGQYMTLGAALMNPVKTVTDVVD